MEDLIHIQKHLKKSFYWQEKSAIANLKIVSLKITIYLIVIFK
jgi:hypothetical protein